MKRRVFIKGAAVMTAGAAAALNGLPISRALAQSGPDLAAVQGGEPGIMFDKAIQAFGGMKKFVKPNQKVVVKPNIGWDTPVERAANTHPELVSRIIKHCLDAGAKEVVVFDHTCDQWKRTYESSGIEAAVKDAGGIMAPGNVGRHYAEVTVPGGKDLKKARVHELVLEADVFINVPVLKHHGGAGLTIGMKNNMGIVWDRGDWHRNGLHQCIADFSTVRKPDLTVVDAYRMLMKNGPRGVSENDTALRKAQIISPDPVAADAASAKLFGIDPAKVPYIRIANEKGVGAMDLSKLAIERIRI
ncbi:Uncharacterized conserved protein, DUF362 family [Desulfatibacillum alkenivorans DSM 16219]|jgi:uncharacterized protein (DUF362 family)|uniref:Uncharacterized conserved protein, DUF362 family n=1 Tax=Desulfatibacillum alkenivorans DSM 16219 TaxID=1121393 RepID=A0A1M6ZEK7_9BACT|nr:DUF362 domain-containing protein [Desulfatibacillum alkenivorans]SHL28775.1 Uncharacterized conserved protein, DUF362 family [Desulfatibacillum alkenivorans DSM 16219]